MEKLTAHYGDIKRNTFFHSHLVNLKQRGSVTEHIQNVQMLSLRVTNILDDYFLDLFMGTLNESIQHEVHLWEPQSLEKDFCVARNVENNVMALEGIPLTSIKRKMFPLLNSCNPQG